MLPVVCQFYQRHNQCASALARTSLSVTAIVAYLAYNRTSIDVIMREPIRVDFLTQSPKNINNHTNSLIHSASYSLARPLTRLHAQKSRFSVLLRSSTMPPEMMHDGVLRTNFVT